LTALVSLLLQRHLGEAHREECCKLYHSSQRLNPQWAVTDGKLATSYDINDALSDFAGLQSAEALSSAACIRAALDAAGFTAAAVQRRLGVQRALPTAGPYYLLKHVDHTSSMRLPPPVDALDTLIRLFLLGLACTPAALQAAVGSAALAALQDLHLVGRCPAQPSLLLPHVQLFPLNVNAAVQGESSLDIVLASDWPPPSSAALIEEPVMYISSCSVALLQHWRALSLSRQQHTATAAVDGSSTTAAAAAATTATAAATAAAASATEAAAAGGDAAAAATSSRAATKLLDLCCGSGVQGLCAAAADPAVTVTAIDLNPRAVRFTRFNAALNGLSARVHAAVGDLYSDSPQCEYDAVLANPPFVPVPPALNSERRLYDAFAAGPGHRGEEMLRRIIAGTCTLLSCGRASQCLLWCSSLLAKASLRTVQLSSSSLDAMKIVLAMWLMSNCLLLVSTLLQHMLIERLLSTLLQHADRATVTSTAIFIAVQIRCVCIPATWRHASCC
jgi:methylase of polypeptide subunit release factors